MFKISTSEFGIMCKRIRACADEFLAMVTEGTVVTESSFGVTQRQDVSGSKWMFRHCIIRLHENLKG